jgi:peptidoglycan LD-endopeptidase LytH
MPRRLVPLVLVLFVMAPQPGLASDPVLIKETPVEHLHLFFPQDPEVTWFLNTYGASRAEGRRHIGIDLHAPKASPVYSIAEGVVTRIARGTSAGAYVIVDHGSGWVSFYMHLDTDEPGTGNGRGGFETAIAPGLAVGSFVDAGTLIGFVGVSGNARHTLPHTHFELHRDGRPINSHSMLVEAHERALMSVQAMRLAAIAGLIA